MLNMERKKTVDSDHVMLLIISLNIITPKPQRVQLSDFKNENGKILFNKLTTETKQFTECFEGMLPLLEKCEKWQKTVETYCVKSYPIIRIRNQNIKTSSADKLIVKRNLLKKQIEDGITKDVDELNVLEIRIAEILEVEETNKANMFKEYCNESNSVNISEMWKLKQKVWPKIQETLLAGKVDNQGHMVTDHEELKKLYAMEFKERLRARPTHPEFVDIQKLKDIIFNLKMKKSFFQ